MKVIRGKPTEDLWIVEILFHLAHKYSPISNVYIIMCPIFQL